MAKVKAVIKVTMCCPEKSRVKAMKIAAASDGVESVALKGDDKDQIEVIGEDIDTVELAKCLRKHVGRADLVSVGPFKEEKKDEKKDDKKDEKKDDRKDEKKDEKKDPVPIYYYASYSYPPYTYYAPAPCYYEVPCCREPSCSIM